MATASAAGFGYRPLESSSADGDPPLQPTFATLSSASWCGLRATALSETRRSMSADGTNDDVAGTTTTIDPLAGLLGGERSEHTDTTACGVTQAAGKQGALAGQGVAAVPVLPVPGVGGEKEDGQAFCQEQVPRKVAEPEPEPHQAE